MHHHQNRHSYHRHCSKPELTRRLTPTKKRYISPLVTPPTPEKLEQDKETVDEQFEKAFVALEQLAKDTESLKASEQERTERLDKALGELEAFVRDAKSAGRRQDDETERLRDDVRALKSAIPNAMSAHKDFTDSRLKEISVEVRSLKSLIGQRITSSSPTAASTILQGGYTIQYMIQDKRSSRRRVKCASVKWGLGCYHSLLARRGR